MRSTKLVPLALVAAVGSSCTGEMGPAVDVPWGLRPSVERADGCDRRDSDGDGIADQIEGRADFDGDGLPNSLDDDSDGDGVPDSLEARSEDPCAPRDSDGDGAFDFYDPDSDNDGLADAREAGLGTDPTSLDTDGDGVTDLGEVEGPGTDPLDPASTVPEGDFFVVLPFEGSHEERDLTFGTEISVADVFFLVDMTGSMRGERTNLIGGLLDVIIPGIEAEIPDVQFGAGGMDDYPHLYYGAGNDLPFYLLRAVGPPDEDVGGWSIAASATSCPYDAASRDVGTITGEPNGREDILEAVEGLPCHGGSDGSESYVPALWATATGMGLSWPTGSIPAQECPAAPDDRGSRRGYPCFRPGALPIVLLFGDAGFHNGPGGADPYSFEAPSFDEAVAALAAIGARVIGVHSGYSADHYDQVAIATGAVRADGSPLVFTISGDGSGLDGTVVDAVAELVGGTPQDVGTRVDDVEGNPDGFDATLFVQSIVPVQGYREGVPGAGFAGMDGSTFFGVIPGTMVEFAIDFWNDVRPPAATAQIFRARIVVVGHGVAELDARNVYIVVPPDGGVVLI